MLNEGTPFFLSYPRTDKNSGSLGGPPSSDRLVQTFFEELCANMEPLVHLPTGSDMGFLDVEGLTGGMDWHSGLMHALGTCQVLVGLLSVPYLKSQWCGREWHAFRLRTRTAVAGANAPWYQGCIIPLRWAPIALELPAVVHERVNIFTPKATRRAPELPLLYGQEGIFRLMRAGEEEAVSEIAWQLAKLIQKIYYGQRLEPREFKPNELINVFEEGET